MLLLINTEAATAGMAAGGGPAYPRVQTCHGRQTDPTQGEVTQLRHGQQCIKQLLHKCKKQQQQQCQESISTQRKLFTVLAVVAEPVVQQIPPLCLQLDKQHQQRQWRMLHSNCQTQQECSLGPQRLDCNLVNRVRTSMLPLHLTTRCVAMCYISLPAASINQQWRSSHQLQIPALLLEQQQSSPLGQHAANPPPPGAPLPRHEGLAAVLYL